MSRQKPSKSKMVRDYLQANPQVRNRDVVAALSNYGVTAADVSNAKTVLKKKYTRRRSRAEAAASTDADSQAAAPQVNNVISIRELETTADYVNSVGGINRAQQLLGLIQQIREM
jgi:hypothetical protein